jgi:protein tyrosine/serine phosphatase
MSVATMGKLEPINSTQAGLTARNLMVVAIFLLTFHLPGHWQKEAAPTVTKQVNSADLPRFRQVHTYFYRGAAPSFAGLDALKKLGVTTVIDLRRSQDRIDEERKYCGWIGLRYISLPMGDYLPSPDKQREFLQIVADAQQNPQHGAVFLHCSHGSDRTGFLTALWRVKHDHYSIIEAAEEMLENGFVIHRFGAKNS